MLIDMEADMKRRSRSASLQVILALASNSATPYVAGLALLTSVMWFTGHHDGAASVLKATIGSKP